MQCVHQMREGIEDQTAALRASALRAAGCTKFLTTPLAQLVLQ